MELIYVVVWLLMGFWCYKIAEKNGRDKTLAFFMGILFVLWAVLVYYVIGKSQKLRNDELEKKIQEKINKTS